MSSLGLLESICVRDFITLSIVFSQWEEGVGLDWRHFRVVREAVNTMIREFTDFHIINSWVSVSGCRLGFGHDGARFLFTCSVDKVYSQSEENIVQQTCTHRLFLEAPLRFGVDGLPRPRFTALGFLRATPTLC